MIDLSSAEFIADFSIEVGFFTFISVFYYSDSLGGGPSIEYIITQR